MTGAALTSWNDGPPGRPPLTPPHSKTPVSPRRGCIAPTLDITRAGQEEILGGSASSSS
jgi:hypothetical protein